MPDRSAIEAGRAFEVTVSQALGLELTAASGNQWHDQGDNRGRGIRASCKANPTTRRSWTQTRQELAESIEIAQGTGATPLLAIQDEDGAKLVLIRLEDLAELIGRGESTVKPRKRSEIVRAKASVPLMRRQP
jgi:hypothetical protein